MTRLFTISLALFFCCFSLTAQSDGPINLRNYDPETEKVYAVKPWLEGVGSVLGLGATAYMFQVINDKDRIDLTTLDRQNVPSYDRWAFPKNVDASEQAEAGSDYFFYGSMALPFALFFDRNIRKDWLDITILYFESQAITGLIYAASPLGPNFIDRARPSAYYTDFDDETRSSGKNLNSFFSGHVSTTVIGTYFFTKVLSDYHPEWSGKQRALAFGLATIPPVYVSIQRVRGLKHFPSDTVVGFGVGALVGILTPHVHKRWQQKHRSSLGVSGFYEEGAGGLGLNLKF